MDARLHGAPRAWALAGVILISVLGLAAGPAATTSDSLRVVAAGERPPDRRLGDVRTLDSHCPFTPPTSPAAWQARATALRRQLRVALGLWPWPTRTPLEALVTGTIERDGYTVEKVAIESVPGHFVTGNVYRPANRTGRLPAVLSPHGHWPGGRFQDVPDAEAKEALSSGGETLDVAAHHFLQARAVQLARLGAIVFLLDLEGYADSQQLGTPLVHGYSHPRPEMETRERWGFFSPQAELHLQSVLGLVAWNAERALDYLSGRPDVDPARIGVTGASGGGTQTMLLGAIDERPAALFPAVMVSTHMQGGCTCENASYLRLSTGNAEIASLIAPRPLGMTSADDWTKEFEHDGYPDVQRVFALLGAPDRVRLTPLTRFPHNYNAPSRAAMYEWFNKYLGLGSDAVPPERPFQPLTREEARVWDAAHPAPVSGPEHERALLEWLTKDTAAALRALEPRDSASWTTWRETVGGAWDVMLGGRWPEGDTATFDAAREVATSAGPARLGFVRRESNGAAIPAALLAAQGTRRGVAVWTDDAGKASLLDASARPLVDALRTAGFDVLAIDVFEQGDYRAQGDPLTHVRLAHTRPHAGYTFGYNLPVPSQRAQDVLTAIETAHGIEKDGPVVLVARGRAAAWAAGARWLAGERITRAALDAGTFRFDTVDRIDAPDFLPGAARYGDVDALLALGASEIWLAGRPAPPPLVTSVRAARGDRPARASGSPLAADAARWLAAP
jgi:hypothetical protein